MGRKFLSSRDKDCARAETGRYRENKITDYKCIEIMAFGISKEVPEAIFLFNSLKGTWYKHVIAGICRRKKC